MVDLLFWKMDFVEPQKRLRDGQSLLKRRFNVKCSVRIKKELFQLLIMEAYFLKSCQIYWIDRFHPIREHSRLNFQHNQNTVININQGFQEQPIWHTVFLKCMWVKLLSCTNIISTFKQNYPKQMFGRDFVKVRISGT